MGLIGAKILRYIYNSEVVTNKMLTKMSEETQIELGEMKATISRLMRVGLIEWTECQKHSFYTIPENRISMIEAII